MYKLSGRNSHPILRKFVSDVSTWYCTGPNYRSLHSHLSLKRKGTISQQTLVVLRFTQLHEDGKLLSTLSCSNQKKLYWRVSEWP